MRTIIDAAAACFGFELVCAVCLVGLLINDDRVTRRERQRLAQAIYDDGYQHLRLVNVAYDQDQSA